VALLLEVLSGTKCKKDDTSPLDNIHSLLRVCDASPSDPSTSHIRETPDNINGMLVLHSTHNRKWVLLYVLVT
jgi:hypothetical protein